jgi:hypothetical protein
VDAWREIAESGLVGHFMPKLARRQAALLQGVAAHHPVPCIHFCHFSAVLALLQHGRSFFEAGVAEPLTA